jgi:hypothetical protein
MGIWSILLPFDEAYGRLVYFVVSGMYIFPNLGYCTKKNLASLRGRNKRVT